LKAQNNPIKNSTQRSNQQKQWIETQKQLIELNTEHNTVHKQLIEY